MAESILTAARVREVLDFSTDPPTYRVNISNMHPGDVAGYINDSGYRIISIDNRNFRAHRLAWLAAFGTWPKHEIDHRNGVRSDNRLENIRDVSHRTNGENLRRASSTNKTSGLLGASYNAGKWAAKIVVNGRIHYLGRFVTPAKAHAAYLEAKRRLHPGCTI